MPLMQMRKKQQQSSSVIAKEERTKKEAELNTFGVRAESPKKRAIGYRVNERMKAKNNNNIKFL